MDIYQPRFDLFQLLFEHTNRDQVNFGFIQKEFGGPDSLVQEQEEVSIFAQLCFEHDQSLVPGV
jgi:hypothetical protein